MVLSNLFAFRPWNRTGFTRVENYWMALKTLFTNTLSSEFKNLLVVNWIDECSNHRQILNKRPYLLGSVYSTAFRVGYNLILSNVFYILSKISYFSCCCFAHKKFSLRFITFKFEPLFAHGGYKVISKTIFIPIYFLQGNLFLTKTVLFEAVNHSLCIYSSSS